MKKRILKYLILFVLLILVILALLPVITSRQVPKVEFKTVKAKRDAIRISVSATGTLSALKTVEVGTQVSGTISKIYVDYNDHVQKGQLIAQIDETLFNADVMEAEGNYRKVEAQYTLKKCEYNRNKKMYEKNLIAQSDLDTYKAADLAAEGELKTMEARLLRAKTNLGYSRIYTPISGVVISRKIDEGQTVAANFATPTLFTLANDLKQMQLLVDVDEADVGQIHYGQKTFFTVDAYPNIVFEGSVEELRLQSKTNQNVVTYTVVVNVPNPDLKLLPGMNATVEIVVSEKMNILTIPISATTFVPSSISNLGGTADHKTYVWILKNNVPQPLTIEIGMNDGVLTEITAGHLTEGDEVIIEEKVNAPSKSSKTGLLPSPDGGPK